jgi:homopolymeric O-antigen transport system permease protein
MIGALSDIFSVITQWRTWVLMGNQDVYMRYRRSVLGPFWISITMGAWVLGIGSLYGRILGHEVGAYLRYLGPSYLAWTYAAALLQDGCRCAIESERHLRSVRIPIPVLAARMVYVNLLILLHNLIAVLAVLAIMGVKIDIAWLIESAPGLATISLMGFFTALVMGPLCLRFRDIQQVISSVMRILFFLTPVLWMESQGRVPRWVVHINPFYHLLEIYRAPFSDRSPTPENWLVAGALLCVMMAMAWIALASSRRKIFLWV